MDGEDSHGFEPNPSDDHEDRRLVPEESPRPGPGAACNTESEAAWPLQLFWSPGELLLPEPGVPWRAACMEEVVDSPLAGVPREFHVEPFRAT